MAASLLNTYPKPYVRTRNGSDIRYYPALSNTRDILLLTRMDDDLIVGASRAAIGAYGYSRRELSRSKLANLSSPETPNDLASRMRRAYAEGALYQTVHRRRDGSSFPVEVISTGVLLAGQQLLFNVIHNLTPPVQISQPLQKSDEIYRALVDSAKNTHSDRPQRDAAEHEAALIAWAHTLELREAEPPGHCQRVADLTEQLAIAMGVSARELIHIRHGALLHDIGKMRIPDSILRKPGPLNKDEWEIVRQHSEYAYQMLSPIDFLRPALDIPYCHHERWDGTGYPRGLAGTDIPLAARIFAVVDVWDTLRSDRPFRKALPDGEAMAYIMEVSGSHFDPAVISIFYSLFRGVRFHLPMQQPAFGIL